MCRLVAYLGSDILLEDILVKPTNSIIMQSLHARESTIPTNGDGFGLGWYAPSISPKPALFTSINPAWNDRNLLNLTAKIKSPCFFAHVRAASSGGVTTYNCHPFVHGKWMLMHNGSIERFIIVKRHLRHLLEDDIYHWIQGETDSEHLFALFLQFAKGRDLSQMNVISTILRETLYQIQELVHYFAHAKNPSYFNICLTDGKRLFAMRYCTDKNQTPETLHYSIGSHVTVNKGHVYMENEGLSNECVIVTSEKLTNLDAEWQDVPPNHLLLVDEHHQLELQPL